MCYVTKRVSLLAGLALRGAQVSWTRARSSPAGGINGRFIALRARWYCRREDIMPQQVAEARVVLISDLGVSHSRIVATRRDVR